MGVKERGSISEGHSSVSCLGSWAVLLTFLSQKIRRKDADCQEKRVWQLVWGYAWRCCWDNELEMLRR